MYMNIAYLHKRPRALLIVFVVSLFGFFILPHVTLAAISPNIDTTEPNHWAWNDVVSWVNFAGNGAQVEVTNAKLTGYASSTSIGLVAFDCATTPNGPQCSANGGYDWWVTNDGNGNLSGWGWNDTIGWISFCGASGSPSTWDNIALIWKCPLSPTYQVKIATSGPTAGDFSGWAWNDVIGWISFCGNATQGSGAGGCPSTPTYKVKTTWTNVPPPPGTNWLTSSTFDTCPSNINCGAALNTIMWKGVLNGGRVYFQIATSDCLNGSSASDCSSPGWNYVGSDGTSNPLYVYAPFFDLISGSSYPAKIITQPGQANKRYFRYKVFLDAGSGTSPEADDIFVNWSP